MPFSCPRRNENISTATRSVKTKNKLHLRVDGSPMPSKSSSSLSWLVSECRKILVVMDCSSWRAGKLSRLTPTIANGWLEKDCARDTNAFTTSTDIDSEHRSS